MKLEKQREKIELASVDDLFSTEESRQDEQLEKIQEIPYLNCIRSRITPSKVKDDDAMIETADSIKSMAFWFLRLPDLCLMAVMSW